MLHNSLFHRERLLTMNKEPAVLHRREVHRTVAPRPGAVAPAGSVTLDGAWAVHVAHNLPAERAVADDAADFLKRMGVAVEPDALKHVLLEIGSAETGFRTVVSADSVEVHASDAAALWAGWVSLENEMREAGGPFLRAGETMREPAWGVQIAPPTWGANYAVPDLSPEYLGDDTFRSLAHAGADGMFVYGDFILYATGTGFPELEHPDAARHLKVLREATERARVYGIRLYYVAVSPKLPADHALFKRLPDVRGARLAAPADPPLHGLCSSNPDALDFHAAVFGRLFKEAPQLGGLILIVGGESYYHCFMRSAGSAVGETNCPHCEGKNAEEQIAHFVKITADAATAQAPNARVMAWPYSAWAFWSKEPNQLGFIDRLPENVSLLSEVDKEQVVTRGALTKVIWDYSVDFDGHSDRIVSQALRCAKRGRGLFVKTETSWGIELMHLPYAPAITRSARQWQSVRALRPAGVLQRWGFIGMFDSAAERVGYQARWNPDFAPDRAALAVARQLVGDALAPQITQAWRHFDDAVHCIPVLTTGGYYMGPAFLGPAHPLPVWAPGGPTPDAFRGNLYYLAEAEASLSNARAAARDDLTLTSARALGGPAEAIQIEFAKARDAAGLGHELLLKLQLDGLPPALREEAVEQQAIGEYLYRTFRTTVNVIYFLRLKEGNVKDADERFTGIARDELENTRAARAMYEVAPWLNHKLRLDIGVPDSVQMIDAKLRLLEAFLAGR